MLQLNILFGLFCGGDGYTMGHSFQTYALRGSEIVFIDDVESGLKCNCTCPGCGEQLIARKGQKRIHHFSHQSSSCEYGYESSLHLAAKAILSTAKMITVPPTYGLFPHSNKGNDSLMAAKTINIDRVELEKQFGSVVPDIVIYTGDKKLFVEIYVTHRVDEEKRKKIEALGISAIEIDLSSTSETITREDLTGILQGDCPEKKWIFNAWAQKSLQALLSYTEDKAIIMRGCALHIDYCPIHIRDFHGKPYANYIDDCIGCDYYFGRKDDSILCSGASLVSTLSDVKLTLEERKALKENLQESIESQNKLIWQALYEKKQETGARADAPRNNTDNKESSTVQNSVREVFKQISNNKIQSVEEANYDASEPVMDDNGWRWMLCTECGSKLRIDNMYTKGSPGNINKGICRKCHKKMK